jgi:flagellum-specific ATP synthase
MPACPWAAAWWKAKGPRSMAAWKNVGSGPWRPWAWSLPGTRGPPGTLTRLTGLVLESSGLRAPVGAQCHLQMPGQEPVLAEVVGFAGDRAFLMPAGDIQGLSCGANGDGGTAVYSPAPIGRHPGAGHGHRRAAPAHWAMACSGRVVDSQGIAAGPWRARCRCGGQPMEREPINAMDRDPVRESPWTPACAPSTACSPWGGAAAGLVCGFGRGQSVLLGMMARYTQADVIVVGLIGERGREVKEFVEDILGEEDRSRAVVVAAPADAPPLLRMQGASLCHGGGRAFPRPRASTCCCSWIRSPAMPWPSAKLPWPLASHRPPRAIHHRALPSCRAGGAQRQWLNGVGSITAFYTVLSEGDDQQDPIADAARAILDGHIVLSRAAGRKGHYPAIDIEQSASRVMHNVVSREHFELARRFRAVYSCYQKSADAAQGHGISTTKTRTKADR